MGAPLALYNLRFGRLDLFDTTLIFKTAHEFAHCLEVCTANQARGLAFLPDETYGNQSAQVMRERRRRDFETLLELSHRQPWRAGSNQYPEQSQAGWMTQRFEARSYILNLHAS